MVRSPESCKTMAKILVNTLRNWIRKHKQIYFIFLLDYCHTIAQHISGLKHEIKYENFIHFFFFFSNKYPIILINLMHNWFGMECFIYLLFFNDVRLVNHQIWTSRISISIHAISIHQWCGKVQHMIVAPPLWMEHQSH